MSVDRVVFDAALTRVQEVVGECGPPCEGKYATPSWCHCMKVTLAALGLDEPPTEHVCALTGDAKMYGYGYCIECGEQIGVFPDESERDEPPTGTSATPEDNLRPVLLCGRCRAGEGGECHTPGCGLWMNRAPDIPVVAVEPPTETPRARACGCKYPGCACRPPSSVVFPVPTETPKALCECGHPLAEHAESGRGPHTVCVQKLDSFPEGGFHGVCPCVRSGIDGGSQC